VATDSNNIGLILEDKGDLDGALTYTQRALRIFMDNFGPDNPAIKRVAINVQRITETKEAKQH
jgi:hypothetical protein